MKEQLGLRDKNLLKQFTVLHITETEHKKQYTKTAGTLANISFLKPYIWFVTV